jgi:predicted PurR-regulated permease PerM
MTSSQAANRFFFILLLLVTVLIALVVRPIASALFTAAVLAGVLWPLHVRLSRRLRGRRAISAGVFVAGVVILLIGPVVAFSAFAITEGGEGLRYVSETLRSEGTAGLLKRLPPSAQRLVHKALDELPRPEGGDLDASVQKQVGAQSAKAAAAVGATLSATASLLFQAAMMLIGLFFFLVQGDEFVSWVDDVSPLKKGQTRELLAEFKKVSFAVITSTVITAGVQAVAALAGYFIARVPHPIFFAAVTFFTAFIPAIGAGAVCLAAALLLFATGHTYAALFLALWGLIIVGLIDNLVKPFLVKAGMEMHGAVVFFSLIGGLGAFGTVGLLLGPLVVAMFLAMLRMYQRDFGGGGAAKAS